MKAGAVLSRALTMVHGQALTVVLRVLTAVLSRALTAVLSSALTVVLSWALTVALRAPPSGRRPTSPAIPHRSRQLLAGHPARSSGLHRASGCSSCGPQRSHAGTRWRPPL